MVVAETKSEGSRHEEKSHRIVGRESPGRPARRHGAGAVAAARRARRREDRVLRALPHGRAAGVPDADGAGPGAALRAEERARPRPPGVSGWQCAERGRARGAPHRAAPLARPECDGRGTHAAQLRVRQCPGPARCPHARSDRRRGDDAEVSRTLEPLHPDVTERAVSKSAVSRRFVGLTSARLTAWLATPLDDLDIRVVLIDGLHFRDHVILLALGVDAQGTKHVLALREGTTENATVCKALLADLRERGLDLERPTLFIIDGGTGLRKA